MRNYQNNQVKRNSMFPTGTKLGPADFFDYNYGTKLLYFKLVGPFTIIIQKLLFRVKVEGLENIPRKTNFIIMPNHISHADSFFAISWLWRYKPFHFIADEKLFKARFFRILAGMFNIFPVRKRAKSTRIVEYAIARVNNGDNLLWYPEGARNKNPADNVTRQGKLGSGMIAHSVNAAIVPVYLSGSEFVLPVGKGLTIGKKIKSLDITIHYGKPVYLEDLRKLPSNKETSQKVIDRIMEHIEKLRPNTEYYDQSYKLN